MKTKIHSEKGLLVYILWHFDVRHFDTQENFMMETEIQKNIFKEP